MRLNPDLIRDILFTLEDQIGYAKGARFSTDIEYNRLNKYRYDEVLYHIDQCEMSGLVIGVTRTLDRTYIVRDLTPSGHAFLADIRSDTNWNKTKEIAKNVGSFSLDAMTKIAVGVITAAINKNI